MRQMDCISLHNISMPNYDEYLQVKSLLIYIFFYKNNIIQLTLFDVKFVN